MAAVTKRIRFDVRRPFRLLLDGKVLDLPALCAAQGCELDSEERDYLEARLLCSPLIHTCYPWNPHSTAPTLYCSEARWQRHERDQLARALPPPAAPAWLTDWFEAA